MSERIPTTVQLPDEPCVVISDGDVVTIATDRVCEPVRQWALSIGPIGRPVMIARLRAIAAQIEAVEQDRMLRIAQASEPTP